jgi:hypothetical protein
VATACGDDEDSAEKVVAGVTDAKPTARNAFSSCGDVAIVMHQCRYTSTPLVTSSSESQQISALAKFNLVHPPSRYHIVP